MLRDGARAYALDQADGCLQRHGGGDRQAGSLEQPDGAIQPSTSGEPSRSAAASG
jgi:hypothetical protein